MNSTEIINSNSTAYHIVVPVYNEAALLESVLQRMRQGGYLQQVTFVNDASTDASARILDRWLVSDGIDVIHLEHNCKKEGAIRIALETLHRQQRLPDKVILLDADSFMAPVENGLSIDQVIAEAAAKMDREDLVAMGFRYDIHLPDKPSLLQKAQFAEFAGLRFMNRAAPQQHQMWVINGRGGIFRSSNLLELLQRLEPDFETGDLMITQQLLKAGHKIAYFDRLKVTTMDVVSVKDFFKQRRRWARGTTRVMLSQRDFYATEVSRLSKIGWMTLLYIVIDIGIPASLLGALLLSGDTAELLLYKLPLSMLVWIVISTSLAISDPGVRREGDTGKVIAWSLLNAMLYIGVTMPSRLTGLTDTIRRVVFNSPRKTNNTTAATVPEASSSS